MTADTLLESLASSRYAQLRTFRRDGRAVDTPMWFHLDGESLVFRTKIGPKTRRLLANPHVEMWPCDYRGRYADGTPTIGGQATILSGAAADAANRALQRRYGWQYNVVPAEGAWREERRSPASDTREAAPRDHQEDLAR